MKSIPMAMGALLLPALVIGGCSKGESGDDKVIEKAALEIKDGMLTPEVLESFGRLAEMTPSPDGSLVAFTLTYTDIEENKGNAEIYLMKPDGSDMTRLTKTAGSESGLQWIDGGKRIAFIAKDDETEKPQIFAIDTKGEGRKRLSKMENGVECFKFSPDGSKIVMGAAIKPYNQDTTLFKGLEKTSGRIVNDLMYKHWDEWVTKIPHPFVADFDGEKVENAKDIMEGELFECPTRPFGGAESFAWSPDGKQLVYSSRKLAGQDYAFSTDTDLFLYDVATGKTRNLTEENPGYDTDPAFSPDGKSLAWLSMKTAKYESDKKRLMVMDMATGAKRDLTENWDYWPEQMKWGPDGKEIFFSGYYQGTEPAFKINVATCAIDTLAAGDWDYSSVTPLPGGKVLAMRRSMKQPNDVVAITNGKAEQITNINEDILSKLADIKVERRMVPTTDGKEMLTWVVLPPNFDPNKKYPAILYCQGGPQQAVSQFWSNRWNFRIMAANGYIVIAPCRRGTPGFGWEWNHQISGDYGGQNMKDYLSAVDYMAKEPYVDAEHIGAIGASYGGFSVYWLAGHHEGRFAALIAHAGIFNMEAQYLETEEMFFADYDMGGNPWDKSNATAQRTFATSPHKFVDKWTAPILITVGELDYRILASQGMMAFNAAKMRGLETEMLVFPDENHWVLQPQNAILWQRVFFRFLGKYLKGEKSDKPEKPYAVTTADSF